MYSVLMEINISRKSVFFNLSDLGYLV